MALPNKYYIKVLLTKNNGSPAYQQVLNTLAANADQAEANIDSVIEKWPDIEYYWVRKISTAPIILSPYFLQIELQYHSHNKHIKMVMNLENDTEANSVFATISEDWENLSGFKMLEVTRKSNPNGQTKNKYHKRYFIQVAVEYNNTQKIQHAVVSRLACDPGEAKQAAIEMVKLWRCAVDAEVIKVSEEPIKLKKYNVEAVLKYRHGHQKSITFLANASNETEAKKQFSEHVANWQKVVAKQILHVDLADNQPKMNKY